MITFPIYFEWVFDMKILFTMQYFIPWAEVIHKELQTWYLKFFYLPCYFSEHIISFIISLTSFLPFLRPLSPLPASALFTAFLNPCVN